jgi:hypothetical protein
MFMMFMILLIDEDDAFRLGMDVADYFYASLWSNFCW